MINILGVWMVLANINFLHQRGDDCWVVFNNHTRYTVTMENISCDKVADLINFHLPND